MSTTILEKKLPIMEAFYTLQGEGYYSGKAAYFIRLGGCDVGCHWCDVKESWNAEDHLGKTVDEIIEGALLYKNRFNVITGGEPFMYDLTELCAEFIKRDFELAVETSGAYPLSGKWHWICLSPKKNKPPVSEFYEQANELKVIIYNKSDFKWAEDHAAKVNQNCKLFLQVEWSKRNELTPLLIEYIKENPQWNISVQSHKYLNIP
jgi:organic radical activating enzyme